MLLNENHCCYYFSTEKKQGLDLCHICYGIGERMGEENIHRTTVYIPKRLYLIAKSMGINMSQAFVKYLEQLIEEDPETVILKEIEEHKEKIRQLEAKLKIIRERNKKQQEKQRAIENVATKIAEFLTLRFKQFIKNTSEEERIWAGSEFIASTIDIIQKDYGIFIEYNEMVKLFEKVDANGFRIEKEDIIPYVVRQRERVEMQ